MNIQLIDLVRRFDDGEIRLPMMQRDFVWKPAKVEKLLDSLYHRWPIGCFYLWHTSQPQKDKKRKDGNNLNYPIDGAYGFLLDGQQRLTSLSHAIAIAREPDNKFDIDTRAFFNVEKECFVLGDSNKTIKKRIAAADPSLVQLSDLVADSMSLQTTIQRIIDGLKESKRLDDPSGPDEIECRKRLQAAATILDQNALCQEFHNDQVEAAIELFSRLNKGGTTLSSGEVAAAELSRKDTEHIVEPMRNFVQSKDLLALGFNFSFATRALVTIHRDSSRVLPLPKNWAADVEKLDASWQTAEKGLQYAATLVRDELGWTTRRWLPSINALIPIAYLFKDHTKLPSKEERESLKRYLLLTGLRGEFRGSVETSINTFVNPIKNAHANTKNRALLLVKRIPQNRLFKIKPDDIKSTVGMYSPLMQVYLAYLISKNAKSWPSGRLIIEVAKGKVHGDPLAVHHIFPRKYMMSLDLPPEQYNTMANYAILSQADNSSLGDRPPADVYAGLSSQERSMASAQLFLRGSDELLNPKNYDEFLDHRAKYLAEALNIFLGL